MAEFATYGLFDPDLGQELIRPAVTREALEDGRLREAYDWVHNGSWLEPSTSRVKKLPAYFRLVESAASGITRALMLIEGLLGLIACALETAGKLRRYSPAVGSRLQEEAMASGAASATVLREIAARADDYYRDILDRSIEQAQGKKSEVRVPRLAEAIAQPPSWTDAYISLARQLGSRPEAATDLLRYAELELVERFVAGRDPEPSQDRFVRTDHRWHSAALSLAASFCQRVWELSDPLFPDLRRARGTLPSGPSGPSSGQVSLLSDAPATKP